MEPKIRKEGVCEASSLLIGIHAVKKKDFLSPGGGIHAGRVSAQGFGDPLFRREMEDGGEMDDGIRKGGTKHASTCQHGGGLISRQTPSENEKTLV